MDSVPKKKPDSVVGEKDDQSKAEARAKRKEAKKTKKENKDVMSNDIKPNKDAEIKSKNKLETKSSDTVSENKTTVDSNLKPNEKSSDMKLNQTEGLSKSELKAQRRAIQEAQRLAKANLKTRKPLKNEEDLKENKAKSSENIDAKSEKKTESSESKTEFQAKRRAMQEVQRHPKEKLKLVNEKTKINQYKGASNKSVSKLKKDLNFSDNLTSRTSTLKKLQLFHHLYNSYNPILLKESSFYIHSAIIRLGAQYMSHTVLGSNARCLALLSALKQLVIDYHTPPNEEFCRSLDNNLQLSTDYLQKCRPLAVSMTNALRHIKLYLTQISTNLSDEEKKDLILEGIDTYIRDEIGMADKAISLFVQAKIVQDDVILIYGCSSIVRKILLDAHNERNDKSFSVIIVDSRPILEGREMLRQLVNAGIKCSYVLINAVSYIMSKATKVLLGAHSLLANGYVMSRAGTAQIALIARSYNKPVLVCCETYKFCERVQTDSIVHNEIGDSEKVIKINSYNESPLKNWKINRYVTPLNLMYDVTPPDLVTAVVTELAILPCTSVPVILRIKPTEISV